MKDQLIEEQKKIIMNRIQNYENKKRKNFKPMILVAAILLIFMMPLFSTSSSSFGITQINANEYTLNIFGDKVHFKFYALMENPNKILINDETSYYEGFQKYFDLTSKFKLEPIEIEGYLFLKMMKGNEVISYLYVDNYDEHTRSVQMIDRKFSNFESEIREIIENVKVYPYEITIESDGWCRVEANQDAWALSEKELEDYLWFKEMQLRVWSSEPIDEYEVVIYLDEAGKMINTGHVIGRYSEELGVDFAVNPTGTLSGHDEVNGLKIASYKYLFEEMDGIPWVAAMKIDFGHLNPDDYEVRLNINDEIVSLQWSLKDEGILYLASEFMPLNQRTENIGGQNESTVPVEMYVELLIVDKLTGEVLVNYSDYNSMGPTIYEEP